MPRSFDIVFESTATVEQVLAAFGSRDYWLARNAEFDGGEKALDSLAVEPDGGVRVVVTEDLRHGALPGSPGRAVDGAGHGAARASPST